MARLMPHIVVTALVPSRRRAGYSFGREPVFLGPEHFADEAEAFDVVASLLADPLLKVACQTEDGALVAIPDALGLLGILDGAAVQDPPPPDSAPATGVQADAGGVPVLPPEVKLDVKPVSKAKGAKKSAPKA